MSLLRLVSRFAVPFLLSASAFGASTPTLSNLNRTEADSIVKNFGNAIVFRSLEPPSANGKIWGLGIGLVVEATSATHVNQALAAHGSSEKIPALPMGDIVLSVQGPLGIGAELGFLPRKSFGGFSAKRTALNARWTFTDLLLRDRTPFDAAIRFGIGKNEFEYNQTVSGAQDKVEFDSSALRLELAMSRRFLFVEPFLGLGMLKTSSTLSNTASVALYNFTTAHSYDYSKSSFFLNLGTEFRFLFLTVGGLVEWAYGETTGAVKLGFKF